MIRLSLFVAGVALLLAWVAFETARQCSLERQRLAEWREGVSDPFEEPAFPVPTMASVRGNDPFRVLEYQMRPHQDSRQLVQ